MSADSIALALGLVRSMVFAWAKACYEGDIKVLAVKLVPDAEPKLDATT